MMSDTATTAAAAWLLQNILRTGRVTADDGTTMDLHSHLPEEAGRMLQRIVGDLEARTTLEIGMAFGVSTLFICEAIADAPNARHIAIDPNQHGAEWRGVGLRHLRLAGLDHLLDFRELPSHQALPDLEREGVRIDFALADGWHTFDFVMVDLFLLDRLLRFFITNRKYRVVECWAEREGSRASQALRKVISDAARHSALLRRPLRPEWSVRDEDLGITPGCRCVALRKTVEDDGRECFGHEEF